MSEMTPYPPITRSNAANQLAEESLQDRLASKAIQDAQDGDVLQVLPLGPWRKTLKGNTP